MLLKPIRKSIVLAAGRNDIDVTIAEAGGAIKPIQLINAGLFEIETSNLIAYDFGNIQAYYQDYGSGGFCIIDGFLVGGTLVWSGILGPFMVPWFIRGTLYSARAGSTGILMLAFKEES